MDLLFIPFYDTIFTNMNLEYIPPDIELIIIEILAIMDIAYATKYITTTLHRYIYINSFEYVHHLEENI